MLLPFVSLDNATFLSVYQLDAPASGRLEKREVHQGLLTRWHVELVLFAHSLARRAGIVEVVLRDRVENEMSTSLF
jgi:hypothetical protein